MPDCLNSLLRQSVPPAEIIVVDDGSADDSVSIVRKIASGAEVVTLGTNRGFAAASNAGIARSSGDFVLVLNNDTELDPSFLEELSRAANDPAVGMVAPKILNWFDRTQIDSVGGLVLTADGIGNGRGRGESDRGQFDHSDEVLLPSGCAALYRKAMLDEIGGFEEDLFAYCEDADLGLRARWAGWRAVSAPRAVVLHKYSQTEGAYSARKLYLVERNHYLVALRTYPLRQLVLLPLWSLARLLLMAWAALRRRGRGEAVTATGTAPLVIALVRAWRDAVIALPRHMGQRPTVRRARASEIARLLERHRLALRKLVLTP